MKDSSKPEENEEFIWTDVDKAHYLIWEYYEGFIQYFSDYIMYQGFNRVKPEIKAGLDKYARMLYILTYQHYNIFKVSLGEENIKKVGGFFKIGENHQCSREEYEWLMRFFEMFMTASGIKSIVKRKASKGIKKISERYKL